MTTYVGAGTGAIGATIVNLVAFIVDRPFGVKLELRVDLDVDIARFGQV